MALGVLMKAHNDLYFGQKLGFFFEFIPQMLLLLGLFGLMDTLIIVKWLTNWEATPGGTSAAPSIISTMIGMGLKFGVVEGETIIPN